jgi:hypothetical protein
MGVEPSVARPPNISKMQRREFVRAFANTDRFKAIIEKAIALARQAQDRYEANVNQHREDTPWYYVNNKVILAMEHYRTGRSTAKLASKCEGPFEVIKAAPYTVTLRLPMNITIFPTFYVSHISRIHLKG